MISMKSARSSNDCYVQIQFASLYKNSRAEPNAIAYVPNQ